VWDPHLQKDIDRIENVQRRAARFIYSDYKRTSSVTAMMNELGWKPLNERGKEQRLVLLFKIVNDPLIIILNITKVHQEHPTVNKYFQPPQRYLYINILSSQEL
jgi:hypothetical protein